MKSINPPLRARILAQIKTIRPGTTRCAGQFARDCGTTLAEARAELVQLALAKKITLCQRGYPVIDPQGLKGPFRVSS